jgi:hypothetical protein
MQPPRLAAEPSADAAQPAAITSYTTEHGRIAFVAGHISFKGKIDAGRTDWITFSNAMPVAKVIPDEYFQQVPGNCM